MFRMLIAFVLGFAAGIAAMIAIDRRPDLSDLRHEAGQVIEGAGTEAANLRLEAAVRAALALQRDFSLLGFGVDADGGQVTLTGDVSTEDQRQLAELIVRGVEGVDAVVNDLEVAPEPER